jgi:sirohydrochlorin ferrochelatase
LTLSKKGFASASYLTAPVLSPALPTCFLFDNGSIRAASTKSLRELAKTLGTRLGQPVRAVSLLHSSKIDPAALDNQPAELLEPSLLNFAQQGGRQAVLLPLFFGASAALTEYLPARVRAIQRHHPELQVIQARWLVDEQLDSVDRVARMLADRVHEVIEQQRLEAPRVLLTDHGSPQPAVTAVRDGLGARLAALLTPTCASVGVASMERRPGDAYRFNDPLLESALRQPPFDAGDVIIALQFLQAGRHAGPNGDVAQICRGAEAERPGLRTYLTQPLVGDPRLVDLLADRYAEALRAGAAVR